ncbi:MAG: nucleotide pyrophosphohydrolase [Promethearchaeota archaeon]
MSNIKTLKEIQKVINEWIHKHGGYWPPLSMLSAIIEEIGEVAREINHLEGFKPKKIKKSESNLGEELADLFFSIICLANNYNIDLEQELYRVLEKFSNRDDKRFT